MNPELRRNLWLELTPARLVAMPVILCGILLLGWIADGGRLGPATAATAGASFGVITWLWGAHLAAESVLAELRNRTWDWQRMSGLAPWALTWGKLTGSTAFPWYGGALCLAAFAAAERSAGGPGKAEIAALLLLGALLAQGIGLLAGLLAARRDRTFTRAQSSAWLGAGALVLFPIVSAAASAGKIRWYGATLEPVAFANRSLVAWVAFALVGAWVQVRRELKVRTLPLAWPAFVLFLMAWVAGFVEWDGLRSLGTRLAAALAVAAGLAWLSAFAERKDPVALRRLLRAAREGRWREAAEDAPAWLLTLPIVLAVALAVGGLPGVLGWPDDAWRVRWTVVAGLAFLGRDLALLLYLNLGARPRRADLFAGVLLLVAWVLVPLVLGALDWKAAAALVLPLPDHAALAAASAVAQCAALWALVARRWRAAGSPAG